MDIIEIATKAGMQVLLDARIGRETYHSVCGSLPALQRFAEAVCAAMHAESCQQPARDEAVKRPKAPPRHSAASRAIRARRRTASRRHASAHSATAAKGHSSAPTTPRSRV